MINKAARKSQKASRTCFVLMPFKGEFERVYEFVYRSVCRENNIHCYRVDENSGPGSITEEIIKGIDEADIIIADLTGQNPNVFYELGVANYSGNKTIMTTQEIEKLPFDIRSYRVLPYSLGDAELIRLKNSLNNAIKGLINVPQPPNNPVQVYLAKKFSSVNPAKKIPFTSFNFDAVQPYLKEAILDSMRNKARRETKIQSLGVSLAYSWQTLRDLLEEELPRKPDSKKLILEISMLDYNWHKFSTLNVKWIASNRTFYIELDEFLDRHAHQIEFKLSTYRYTPNWHGHLVDGEQLFLSNCVFKEAGGSYRLSVGTNRYEYFKKPDNPAAENKIEQFKCWFEWDNEQVSREEIKKRAKEFLG